MKDARGVTINIGDSVVYAQQQKIKRGSWATLSWGTVVKFTAKMVKIEISNCTVVNKIPHNIVVVILK